MSPMSKKGGGGDGWGLAFVTLIEPTPSCIPAGDFRFQLSCIVLIVHSVFKCEAVVIKFLFTVMLFIQYSWTRV